jgi:hypothetical protein
MPSDSPSEDVRNIWQNQPSEGADMLLEEVRKRITKFDREQWRIKVVGRITAVIVLAMTGFWFYVGNALVDIGTALVLAGFLYAWWWMGRRRAAKTMPQDCGLKRSVDFYRGELERELDVQRSVWWPLAAIVLGILIAIAGVQYGRMAHFAEHFLTTAAGLVPIVFVCWLFNRQQTKVLQRRIDDLDAMVKEG